MLLTKPAIKPGVLPISIAEFREALYSVCSWNRIGKNRGPPNSDFEERFCILTAITAALAVSGGVDSMALAALCSRFKKEENALLDVTAFVVDHKLRCGSTTEANDVVQQLQDLGTYRLTELFSTAFADRSIRYTSTSAGSGVAARC